MNCTSQRVKRAKQRIADEKYATGQKKLTPKEKAAKSQRLRTGTQALAAAMSVITMTNGPYSKLV